MGLGRITVKKLDKIGLTNKYYAVHDKLQTSIVLRINENNVLYCAFNNDVPLKNTESAAKQHYDVVNENEFQKKDGDSGYLLIFDSDSFNKAAKSLYPGKDAPEKYAENNFDEWKKECYWCLWRWEDYYKYHNGKNLPTAPIRKKKKDGYSYTGPDGLPIITDDWGRVFETSEGIVARLNDTFRDLKIQGPGSGKASAEPSSVNTLNVLEQQKQIILYGPPGTGKTFLARQLAARLLNRDDAEQPETPAPAEDSLPADGQGADEKSKKESLNIDKILDDAGKDNRFAMVQFHPGYSYSDFVEGIAPGKEGFAPTGRIFREVAEKAAENPQQPCVLIIDEINRARIADTFGELLYGLENRESPIDTALSHTLGKLSVPKNLYIIGTMNTADRTLAALDYALRRRFAFCPVPAPDPESSMIFNLIPKESEGLCLYKRIYEDVGLAAAKGVSPEDIRPGPGYFMNTMGSKLEGEALRAYLKFKLDYQLWPLLQEYVKNGLLRARVKVGANRDHTIASEEYHEELRALLQPGGGAK